MSAPLHAARLALRNKLLTLPSNSLPAARSWENAGDGKGNAFTPTAGAAWLEEEFLPGPVRTFQCGTKREWLPLYVLKVYVPSLGGATAADTYSGAILDLFAPGTAITVSGAYMTVRGNPAPYSGQLLQAEPGWAVVTVTVPLLLREA